MKSSELFRRGARGAAALFIASQLQSTPVFAQETTVFSAPVVMQSQQDEEQFTSPAEEFLNSVETPTVPEVEKTVIDPLSIAVIEQVYAGRPAAAVAPLIVKYSIENNLDPDLITAVGMIESGAGAGAPRGYWFGVTSVYLPTRDLEIKYVAELLAGKKLPQYKTATEDWQKLSIFNGGQIGRWNDPAYLQKFNDVKGKLNGARSYLAPFFETAPQLNPLPQEDIIYPSQEEIPQTGQT